MTPSVAPSSTITWVLGALGESCDTVCGKMVPRKVCSGLKFSDSGNLESGFTSIADWAKDGQSLVFDSNSITCDKYGSGDNYDNIYGPYYNPNEDQYLEDGVTVSGTLKACYYPVNPIGSDCTTAADPFQRLCPCEGITSGVGSVCYHYPVLCSYAAERNSECCVGCAVSDFPDERKCLGDPDNYANCYPHCVYIAPTFTPTSTPS